MIQILEAKNALLDYKNKTRKNMFTNQPNIKEFFSLIIYLGRVNNCPEPPYPLQQNDCNIPLTPACKSAL